MGYVKNIHVIVIDMNKINVYIGDMNSGKTHYNNKNRNKKAEENKIGIIKAVGRLWMQYPINEITLEMIAQDAGVTTRTILRKFGSKENLVAESLSYDPAGISAERDNVKVGDIDDLLRTLLSNYENMGEAAIRTIFLEPGFEIARKIGEQGRKQHRAWCIKVFAPYLPDRKSKEFEIQLNSFIAVTEIYLWKLLRKDQKLSKAKTFTIFKNMVEGVVHQSLKSKKP